MPAGGDQIPQERNAMNIAFPQSVTQARPATPSRPRPGLLDRVALRLGIALVEWANRAEADQSARIERRLRRGERAQNPGPQHPARAHQRAAAEPSLLFRNLQ